MWPWIGPSLWRETPSLEQLMFFFCSLRFRFFPRFLDASLLRFILSCWNDSFEHVQMILLIMYKWFIVTRNDWYYLMIITKRYILFYLFEIEESSSLEFLSSVVWETTLFGVMGDLIKSPFKSSVVYYTDVRVMHHWNDTSQGVMYGGFQGGPCLEHMIPETRFLYVGFQGVM